MNVTAIKYRAAGLCSCGRHVENGYKQCASCLARQRKNRINRLKRYTEAGLCLFCGQPAVQRTDNMPGKQTGRTNKTLCDVCKLRERERHKTMKDAAFNAYGGYCCNCCGETVVEFLQIDHVNNDGALHRRKINNSNCSSNLYRWLKRNDYPLGFQVLCANCNIGKHLNGGICPHKKVVQ